MENNSQLSSYMGNQAEIDYPKFFTLVQARTTHYDNENWSFKLPIIVQRIISRSNDMGILAGVLFLIWKFFYLKCVSYSISGLYYVHNTLYLPVV